MDKFYDILREEIENALMVGGAYANKERMLQTFDKAFAKAVVRYARMMGVDLT